MHSVVPVNGQTANRHANQLSEIAGGKKSAVNSSAALIQIGERLLGRVGRADAANSNVRMAQSRSLTASAAQQQTFDSLARLKDLSIRAGDGTLSARDRNALNNEARDIVDSLRDNSRNLRFNGERIMDTEAVSTTASADGADVTVSGGISDPDALNLDDIDLSTAEGAAAAGEAIDEAVEAVGAQAVRLGAEQQAFERQFAANLTDAEQSLSAGVDLVFTDIARSMVNGTSASIMADVGAALQAQATNLEAQSLQMLIPR